MPSRTWNIWPRRQHCKLLSIPIGPGLQHYFYLQVYKVAFDPRIYLFSPYSIIPKSHPPDRHSDNLDNHTSDWYRDRHRPADQHGHGGDPPPPLQRLL
jgi:hypothetical protein